MLALCVNLSCNFTMAHGYTVILLLCLVCASHARRIGDTVDQHEPMRRAVIIEEHQTEVEPELRTIFDSDATVKYPSVLDGSRRALFPAAINCSADNMFPDRNDECREPFYDI